MDLEIAFREAVREDTGLILQFIRELAAYEKLLQLAELHGTQTEAIAFALERLWRKEVENKQ